MVFVHRSFGIKIKGYDINLGVVGAYPNGMPVDIMRGEPGERPGVLNNIAAVPFPDTDLLQGKNDGLRKIWKR